MKHLKPVTIKEIVLEPIALADGTLLFFNRDEAASRIGVVTTENLYSYIASLDDDFVSAILPLEHDIDAWIHENFPEPTFDTHVIFGERAVRDYLDGDLDAEKYPDYDPFDQTAGSGAHSLEHIESFAGNHDGVLVSRSFSTEEERTAYFLGLDDNDGWGDSYSIDPEEIAA